MEVRQLNQKNFFKWGSYISADQSATKSKFEGFCYTGNVAVCELWPETSVSVLEPKKRDICLKSMEAHRETAEMCVAIENDCIFFVAADRDGAPDIDSAEAFLLKAGDTIIYNKSVWHWVPFAIDTPSCKQLIIYRNNTGTTDFYQHDLKDPITVSF